MIDTIIQWIHETAAHEEYSFVDASTAIDRRVAGLSKPQILELIEEIHVIPESFHHDSSEEKIYAKVSDSIVAAAFRHLGLTTRVLSERGDAAALILISAVLISGQTFGQRASKKYLRGTPEWNREVKRLDKTKNEKPREENNFNQVK
tara:strand:+ start:1729 stop:2172 length:444 start_codon:yes stop_codon:yes gene_type:complete